MRAFFLPIQLPASSAWKSDIESVLPAEKHTHSLRGHEKWGSPLFVTSGACHWSVKFYAQTGTHTHTHTNSNFALSPPILSIRCADRCVCHGVINATQHVAGINLTREFTSPAAFGRPAVSGACWSWKSHTIRG